MPREGTARLQWLAELSFAVAMDAVKSAEQIANEFDASPTEIESTVMGLARYVCDRIIDAVLLGFDVWEATTR